MRRSVPFLFVLFLCMGTAVVQAQTCGDVLTENTTLGQDLDCPLTALTLDADGMNIRGKLQVTICHWYIVCIPASCRATFQTKAWT